MRQAAERWILPPIRRSPGLLALRVLVLLAATTGPSIAQTITVDNGPGTGTVLAMLLLCLVIGVLAVLLVRRSRHNHRLQAKLRAARDATEIARADWRAEMAQRERAEAALHRTQRIEVVGRLTGGVAHDFNNVLIVLLGNIDLLQLIGRAAADQRDRLARMRAAADRGASGDRPVARLRPPPAAGAAA